MRIVFLVTATTLLALAVPVHAAEHPPLSEVGMGDPDLGQSLREASMAAVSFLDANNNGRLDVADPDEPVYLDLDASRVLGYGDLRLLPFLRYPAGSVVDLANRDAGRALASIPGWFARDGTTWYLDSDSSGTVSIADLRFTDTIEKVRLGDPYLGKTLTGTGTSRGTVAWSDPGNDGSRQALDPLYLDLGAVGPEGRKVSIGDLRITPQGMGLDDDANQTDVAAAVATAKATMAPPAPVTTAPSADATSAPGPALAPSEWRTLDWVLVVVGVANLAGLVVVGRMATARQPRNPGQ